jgi:pilus assembly protein CpaE
MIRAAIICPDQDLSSQFQTALAGLREVGVGRVLDQYPNEAKLPAFLRASAPELIFLSSESPSDAADVASRIGAQGSGIPVVAISRNSDGPAMLQMLRAGAKDFLVAPFESQLIHALLRRVETMLAGREGPVFRQAPIFAFLPAKAGCGATTIAVNTSLALARMPKTKPLLIDLDLNSGLVQFMLSIKPQYSITDAADNAPEMDETLWSKIVSSVDNLDVLPAGTPRTGYRIESSQIRRILEFARRNYDAVCVDLSGMMEKYSVDLLHEVTRVFLVCTPEVASMHLACAKLEALRQLELDERVGILVNRAEKGPRAIPVLEMEKIFRRKTVLALPNAYEETRQAGIAARPVKATSELGMSFARLARTMLPLAEPVIETRRSILDLLRASKMAPANASDTG